MLSLPVFTQIFPDSAIMDSSVVHNMNGSAEPDEEFNLFLAALAFVGVSIMIGTAIAIIVLALLIVLAIIALIGIGVLSVSLGAGIYRRSVSTGLRTALMLTAGSMGTLIGAGAGWLSKQLFTFSLSTQSTMLIGGIAGLVGGVIASWGLMRLIRILFRKFQQG